MQVSPEELELNTDLKSSLELLKGDMPIIVDIKSGHEGIQSSWAEPSLILSFIAPAQRGQFVPCDVPGTVSIALVEYLRQCMRPTCMYRFLLLTNSVLDLCKEVFVVVPPAGLLHIASLAAQFLMELRNC